MGVNTPVYYIVKVLYIMALLTPQYYNIPQLQSTQLHNQCMFIKKKNYKMLKSQSFSHCAIA